MKWSKWPYWLSTGTHVSFLLVLVVSVLYFVGAIKVVPYVLQCLVPPCSEVLHVYVLGTGPIVRDEAQLALCGLLLLIGSFIVGVIVGWLYGKIKAPSVHA